MKTKPVPRATCPVMNARQKVSDFIQRACFDENECVLHSARCLGDDERVAAPAEFPIYGGATIAAVFECC